MIRHDKRLNQESNPSEEHFNALREWNAIIDEDFNQRLNNKSAQHANVVSIFEAHCILLFFALWLDFIHSGDELHVDVDGEERQLEEAFYRHQTKLLCRTAETRLYRACLEFRLAVAL